MLLIIETLAKMIFIKSIEIIIEYYECQKHHLTLPYEFSFEVHESNTESNQDTQRADGPVD